MTDKPAESAVERTGSAWWTRNWNVVDGCSHVSPACDHCYAERMAGRNLPVTAKIRWLKDGMNNLWASLLLWRKCGWSPWAL